MKRPATTQRNSVWSSKLVNVSGLVLGSASLVAVFLWQRSAPVPAEQAAAGATASLLAQDSGSAPTSTPAIQSDDRIQRGNQAVVSLALKSTGSLNSGESVAKITVNGATAVYLPGERLGADASLLSVRDDEISIQRGNNVETLRAEVRGSTFGQQRAAARPMPPNAVPSLAAASINPSDAAAEVASYGAKVTQQPPGYLAAMLGLQVGDTVIQINGRTVAAGDDLSALLSELESRKVPVWLQGERSGQTISLRYKP